MARAPRHRKRMRDTTIDDDALAARAFMLHAQPRNDFAIAAADGLEFVSAHKRLAVVDFSVHNDMPRAGTKRLHGRGVEAVDLQPVEIQSAFLVDDKSSALVGSSMLNLVDGVVNFRIGKCRVLRGDPNCDSAHASFSFLLTKLVSKYILSK